MIGFDLKVDEMFSGGTSEMISDDYGDNIIIPNGILKEIDLDFSNIGRKEAAVITFENLQAEKFNGKVNHPTFHLNFINKDEPAHINYHNGDIDKQITISPSDIENIKMVEIPLEDMFYYYNVDNMYYYDINNMIHIIK